MRVLSINGKMSIMPIPSASPLHADRVEWKGFVESLEDREFSVINFDAWAKENVRVVLITLIFPIGASCSLMENC